MVTTTLDLSVQITDNEICISYITDDYNLAYEGYWSDYEGRAITEVILPASVVATAHAYEFCGLIDKASEKIFLLPVNRAGMLDLWS